VQGEDEQVFNDRKTWFDNPQKCKTCGVLQNEHTGLDHAWKESENKVAELYNRLNGIAVVYHKKDCVNLPEKIHEFIRIKPTVEIVKYAKLLPNSPSVDSAMELRIRIRELCDGFIRSGDDVEEIPCPKYDYLVDELDANPEGRLIVWAAFTKTVDRIVEVCKQYKCTVLRIDGRGYHGYTPEGNEIDSGELFKAMDLSSPNFEELKDKYPRLVVVGNPKAGGMAFTLTGSSKMIYFSNDYDAESRIQSEARNHRLGITKACLIEDYVMLKIEKDIIDILREKKNLQSLTMGDLEGGLHTW
jgi:SNF2 family DNA or RNA helicase